MAKRDRAEYMRQYRSRLAKERGEREMEIVMRTGTAVHDALTPDIRAAQKRIAELEAEIRHLKAELAKRPTVVDERFVTTDAQLRDVARFNTRPFTPVPKTRK